LKRITGDVAVEILAGKNPARNPKLKNPSLLNRSLEAFKTEAMDTFELTTRYGPGGVIELANSSNASAAS
jgi:hypothetical protein